MTLIAYGMTAGLIFFFGCLAFEELEGVYSGYVSRLQSSEA